MVALDMTWPPLTPVAHLVGSLPMGGHVPKAPVHAFTTTPEVLRFGDLPHSPKRRDINLGDQLAFVIDPVITDAEADAIVAACERMGYRPEAPGIRTPPGMRMNKSVHWVADEALMKPVFERIQHLLPAEIDGGKLFPGFSHRMNMYRYDDQDVFNRHIDGSWPGYSLSKDRSKMQQWPEELHSALTMLLYLNGPEDGVEGGHTRLFLRSGEEDVVPKKGSALFFRHGSGPGSVMHMGCPVSGEVPKHVARINVMYDWSEAMDAQS